MSKLNLAREQSRAPKVGLPQSGYMRQLSAKTLGANQRATTAQSGTALRAGGA